MLDTTLPPAQQMEVEPSSFETDPEGQALAAAINASLPPEVGCGCWMGLACGGQPTHDTAAAAVPGGMGVIQGNADHLQLLIWPSHAAPSHAMPWHAMRCRVMPC